MARKQKMDPDIERLVSACSLVGTAQQARELAVYLADERLLDPEEVAAAVGIQDEEIPGIMCSVRAAISNNRNMRARVESVRTKLAPKKQASQPAKASAPPPPVQAPADEIEEEALDEVGALFARLRRLTRPLTNPGPGIAPPKPEQIIRHALEAAAELYQTSTDNLCGVHRRGQGPRRRTVTFFLVKIVGLRPAAVASALHFGSASLKIMCGLVRCDLYSDPNLHDELEHLAHATVSRVFMETEVSPERASSGG